MCHKFQIIVRPREHILVLFEQVDKGLSLLLCATCAKISELWILLCSQVYQFMHHVGTVGLFVPWPLEAFLQVVNLLQRCHTLHDKVAFPVTNFCLQISLMLVIIYHCIFEDVSICHEMQYLLIIITCVS